MVFSKVVNDMNGPLGFVFSGDFSSRSNCSSSDEGEVFYGIVPTDTATDFSTSGGIGQWQRQMRATFIHEVKHITSNAERISRGSSLEALWLEEATAHLSEELWARQLYGYSQNGNVQYTDGVHCEVRPTTSGCENGPLAVFSNFSFLFDYFESNESRTPLGQSNSSDNTFRGSGWWITRYAVDQSGRSESDFLSALTQEGSLTGIDNLTDKAGIDWETMLARWTLALLADDDPSASTVPGDFTQPTWDTRDIFQGMHDDFCQNQNLFCGPFPLDFRPVQFGSFTESVSGGVRGGTAALFELSGTQSAKQLLHLRGQSGNPLPASLRLAIVRVE